VIEEIVDRGFVLGNRARESERSDAIEACNNAMPRPGCNRGVAPAAVPRGSDERENGEDEEP